MKAFAPIPNHTAVTISARIGGSEVRLNTSIRLDDPERAEHVLEFCFDRIRIHVSKLGGAAG